MKHIPQYFAREYEEGFVASEPMTFELRLLSIESFTYDDIDRRNFGTA